MARARNIKPGFFKNEDLAEIEPLGRLLFAGLWTIADREGRLEDRPKRIKAELLPYDDCDSDTLLEALHQRGFIIRYMAEGERYIAILSFDKHQNPHRNECDSVIPCPDMNRAGADHAPEDFIPRTETAPEDFAPRTEAVPEKDSSAPADSLISDSLISESLNSDSFQKPLVPPPGDESTGTEKTPRPPAQDKTSRIFGPASPEYKLAAYLLSKIRELDRKAREPNLQLWAMDIDKMIRLDKRSPAEVKDLIDFAHSDSFWRSNILSAGKLRDKATALTAKMIENAKRGGTGYGVNAKPAGKGAEAAADPRFDASKYCYRADG